MRIFRIQCWISRIGDLSAKRTRWIGCCETSCAPKSALWQSNNVHQDDEGGEPTKMISLANLLRPSSNCQVDRMSATDLAYLGDVVYELFIRSRTVWPPKRTADLQEQVVALVRGK